MRNIKTIQGVVTQTTISKTNTSYPQVTLQIRNDSGSALVRLSTPIPPLPGTEILVTGSITPFSNSKGHFLSVSSDKNLNYVSGQQGVILRDIVVGLLNHLAIPHDKTMVNSVLLDKNLHLVSVNEIVMLDILNRLNVPDAAQIMDDYKTIFSDNLVRGMMAGCERSKFPFVLDTKRTNPFKSGAWPQKVMHGCMPDFITIPLGQQPHPDMAANRKLYISDHLAHEGIDNFFRAISISTGIDSVFSQWVNSNKRDGVLTSAYLRDKQAEGVQMFSAEHLERLKIFGIRRPEETASRLGNMFRVQLPRSNGHVLIPQGTYQSSSRIALLDNLPEKAMPLIDMSTGDPIVPDLHGLDVHQAEAVKQFCEGAPLMLVAGPPGTGKTTTISRFINMAQMAGEDIMVLAPTGKAAARLNQGFASVNFVHGRPHATTIHSVFFSSQTAFGADRNKQMSFPVFALRAALDGEAHEMFPVRVDRIVANPSVLDKKSNTLIPRSKDALFHDMAPPPALAGKTVIIDESSQITNDLMALVLAMQPKRIVLTGDPWQLPPVGAGKPFQDMINLVLDGEGDARMVLANLQIDHRATKYLAAMTAEVRKGSLPIHGVRVIGQENSPSYNAVAEDFMTREFGIAETPAIDEAVEMVRNIYIQEMARNKPLFSMDNAETFNLNKLDAASSTLVFDRKMAKKLSCQKTALPDIMTMAYTNEEVQSLASMIKTTLDADRVAGNDMPHALPFSVLASNNLMPGHIIMQTTNDKTSFEYNTPQGKRTHKGTMNGESYLFAGANVWLPLPGQAPAGSDIDVKLNNLWKKVKLHQDAVNIANGSQMADPDAHWALYSKLLHASPKKEAGQLLRMAMGEVILVDYALLQDIKVPRGAHIHAESQPGLVRRLAVLPNISTRKAVGAIVNDLGDYGLVQHFWNISSNKQTRQSTSGNGDNVTRYNEIASATNHNLGQFTVGEACTVHKMQGSQCGTSVTFVGPPSRPETSRQHEQACYTGITRAKERALLVVHGQTVEEINALWKSNREINQSIESPVQAIARGDMPPLENTFALFTATLPGDSPFKGNKLFGAAAQNADDEFRKRTVLSSQKLPGDMDLTNVPVPHRNMVLSLESNATGIAPAHNYTLQWPDSKRIFDHKADGDVLNRKAAYTRIVSMTSEKDVNTDLVDIDSVSKAENANEKDIYSVDQAMDSVFSSFF
jgi:hypothetical protein